MAIFNGADASDLRAILKSYYKDDVPNLLGRESPLLQKMKTSYVEGKEVSYPAIYSAGGAVAADGTVAEALANEGNFKAQEWKVEPGQLFSVIKFDAKEVLASKTKKGAYMKLAGAKVYAQTVRFRKALASSLYSRGYGELAVLGNDYAFVASTPIDITVPSNVIQAVQVGSAIVVKTAVESATEQTVLKVTKMSASNKKLTVIPSTTYTCNATDVICFKGAMDSAGNPMFPKGLAEWIPTIGARNGADWENYIAVPSNGINRSTYVEALAGSFVDGSAKATILETIQELIMNLRNQGSKADMIVMNPIDRMKFEKEIDAANRIFTKADTKAARSVSAGLKDISVAFQTSYVDTIIDDPFLSEGLVYCLDSDYVEYWTLSNLDTPKNTGKDADAADNIDDPMSYDSKGEDVDSSYKLLVDNYLSVVPGGMGANGETTRVTVNLFGTIGIMNTAVNGAALLPGAVAANIVQCCK